MAIQAHRLPDQYDACRTAGIGVHGVEILGYRPRPRQVVKPKPRAKFVPAVAALPTTTKIKSLITFIAARHGVGPAGMLGRQQRRELTAARQEAMAVLAEQMGLSLPAIGKLFNRDHSTVLYSIRQHNKRRNAEVAK